MSLSERDRKILMLLVPLAIVLAYWFVVLAPKREEAAVVKEELTQVESERDIAVQKAASLTAAKRSFATDYADVIYLGKAAPTSLDMQSLMVQLDRSARGTGIEFTSITAGERTGAGTSDKTSGGNSGAPNGGNGPASSSEPAQSGAGQNAQSAGNSVESSNSSGATGQGGSSSGATPSGSAPATPGLDSVPLDFQFDGSFFELADFFHRMKRFVRVANGKIMVRGRLLTLNNWTFDTKESGFPHVKATVHATVYLAPKTQGVSAGASPTGPGATPPPPTGQSASSSTPTPAATVTAP